MDTPEIMWLLVVLLLVAFSITFSGLVLLREKNRKLKQRLKEAKEITEAMLVLSQCRNQSLDK